jgi:hypothetical protein
LAWDIAAFEHREPDFDVGLPIAIVVKYVDQFMVGPFCAPSFDLKTFDYESLVLFAHIYRVFQQGVASADGLN